MATDICKNFIREIASYGAMPIILEPIASGSLFSPKMFDKIAYPYIKELVDLAHELKALIPLHICGIFRQKHLFYSIGCRDYCLLKTMSINGS